MDIHEINRILREKAIAAGLCNEWQQKIWNRDLSVTELLTIYKRGIDFSLKQEWFDYDFIKEEFSLDELHENLIYIDEEIDISDAESGTWVFLGECTGKVTFRDFSVGNIYVRHTSNIKVESEDMSKVFVSIYDDAMAELDTMDCSTGKLYDRRK